MKIKIFFLFITLLTTTGIYAQEGGMYFCTAIDSNFFEDGLNLIGSIHRVNFEQTKEIAIFNLGLTIEQRSILNLIQKVKVYDLELTHPDLLKMFEIGRAGKKAKGWYAWKPVAIKQSLDMFPHVLYLDAGTVVLRPLDYLFEHIKKEGYYLPSFVAKSEKNMPEVLTVKAHSTQYIIDKFNLEKNLSWIARSTMVIAGIQGLSKAFYQSYILPVYELTRDLKNFEDDGSCPGGFGQGYSDMPLFSIYAYLLNMNLIEQYKSYQLDPQKNDSDFLLACGYNVPANASIVYQIRGRFQFAHYIKLNEDSQRKKISQLVTFSKNF